jgi:hypothetical protein
MDPLVKNGVPQRPPVRPQPSPNPVKRGIPANKNAPPAQNWDWGRSPTAPTRNPLYNVGGFLLRRLSTIAGPLLIPSNNFEDEQSKLTNPQIRNDIVTPEAMERVPMFGTEALVSRGLPDFVYDNLANYEFMWEYDTAPKLAIPQYELPPAPRFDPNPPPQALATYSDIAITWERAVENIRQRMRIGERRHELDWANYYANQLEAPTSPTMYDLPPAPTFTPYAPQFSPGYWSSPMPGAKPEWYGPIPGINDPNYNDWLNYLQALVAWTNYYNAYQAALAQYNSDLADYNDALDEYNDALDEYQITEARIAKNTTAFEFGLLWNYGPIGTNARTAAAATPRGRSRPQYDRKTKSAKLYRTALSLINNSYGKASEVFEFWEAFLMNLEYKDGTPIEYRYRLALMQEYRNPSNVREIYQQMNKVLDMYIAGHLEMNWAGLLRQVVFNQVQDYMIGQVSKSINENINQRSNRPVGVQFGPAI